VVASAGHSCREYDSSSGGYALPQALVYRFSLLERVPPMKPAYERSLAAYKENAQRVDRLVSGGITEENRGLVVDAIFRDMTLSMERQLKLVRRINDGKSVTLRDVYRKRQDLGELEEMFRCWDELESVPLKDRLPAELFDGRPKSFLEVMEVLGIQSGEELNQIILGTASPVKAKPTTRPASPRPASPRPATVDPATVPFLLKAKALLKK